MNRVRNITRTLEGVRTHKLSVRRGAGLLQMPYRAFLELMAAHRVPSIDYAAGSLDQEMHRFEQGSRQTPAYVFLDRHVNGDWGEVPEEDKQENEFSVQHGFRILSAYTTSAGEKIWIITEADRSATTMLLPNEY
jgi:hypothetical protein